MISFKMHSGVGIARSMWKTQAVHFHAWCKTEARRCKYSYPVSWWPKSEMYLDILLAMTSSALATKRLR